MKPDKTVEQATAVVEARSESLKLRSQLKRTDEERDILNEHRREHAIQRTCRLLAVSRSGFYEWVRRPLSVRATEYKRLLVLIRASLSASGGVYGQRHWFEDLPEIGERCGRHRVFES